MNIYKLIISSSLLLILVAAFSKKTKSRYFEHFGVRVSEIQTSETVVIANNSVGFLNAGEVDVSLTAIDSIFNTNIVSLIPDSHKNNTFNMKYFAIPIGVKKFTIQPIIPILPGKLRAKTINPRPHGLFDKTIFYDRDKRRVGVFKLKHRPYYFLLHY
jgi:hypothetical protein